MESEPKIIINLTRASVVCERAQIADRPMSRMRGLIGRVELPTGCGMLLQPAPSIHTAFMRFPIDVVFVDNAFRVVKIVALLRPWRIASARRARAVLELSAGESTRRNVQLGDRFGILDASEQQRPGGADAQAARLARLNAGSAAFDGEPAEEALNTTLSRSAAPPTNSEANGARVLVVATDRRFRAVTGALLTRRGCAVTLAERMSDSAELAKREEAEVVVLEAGTSLTAAARAVAQIEALNPRVGVVVVGEQPERGLTALPVLAKWDSFDRLYGAIERARPAPVQRKHSA